MNPKAICGCLLFLTCCTSVFACANKTGTKYGGGSGPYFVSHMDLQAAFNKDLKPDGVEMESSLRGATNFNDRSDYAIALMFLGRNAEAIKLLQKLEQEKPGQYFIAANLGTAYELAGNNGEALKWINEGIKRNPDDHAGTEWLHAKILEAKIAHAKDPKHFEKHSVLELEPGSIGETVTIGGGRRFAPKELARAIQYQLGERMQFVKPRDPAVASLLFDYAAIEAAIASMESAKRVLKMATRYGYPAAKVDALNQEFDRRLFWKSFRMYSVLAFFVLVIVALFVLYKRWRRKASAVGSAE